ncbi:hypothetical protein ACK8HX_02595 [Oryzobacter sp. R7]|uniref:hypothetical protein n=1 Tax=Oryzobacter faecalis TaxID=3388656 RepID=UPI00398C8703
MSRWRTAGWPLVLVGFLLVVAVVPLVRVPRYYFRGDTQIAYLGWWYHLGERVLAGDLPLMEPLAWEAGNYVAEGQWGLFSPLTILIGVLATLVGDVVVFVTVLKVVLVVVGGLGAAVLVRDYGASRPVALVAGAVVGLSGQAVVLDWPSWVTGQIGVALLPWAWWAVRRAMAGRSPALALALCYLVVSVGYVYCAIYLAVVLLGCLVDGALSRSRRRLLVALGAGVFSGLVTVAVYLPGVLTSPVTVRDAWGLTGAGRLTVDLQDVLTGMLPEPRATYLVWLLPVLAWIDLRRLRRSWRDLAGAAVATVVLLLWAVGPAEIGPLRWPIRVVPALMVALVTLVAVAVSRSLPWRVPAARRVLALAWVAGAAYVVLSREPYRYLPVLVGAAIVAMALEATAWLLRRRRANAATAVVLGTTLAVFGVQYAAHPQPPSVDRHMPAEAAEYRERIPTARGDVIVLGNPDYYEKSQMVRNAAIADDVLIAASWYLSEKSVQNGYTTISHRPFRERFCRVFNGGTCTRALAELLEVEPTTGKPWVDLLSVSTVVLYRPYFPDDVERRPPPGWSITDTTDFTVVWNRAEQLPTAGGVVATSGGLAVSEVGVDDRRVRLRVDRVGAQGGTVTFSRLAWPGYRVEGGTLAAPLDDVLVRVEVPPGAAGRTVTLAWSPPGWAIEVAALVTALAGGLLWVLAAAVGSRRRHEPATSPTDDPDGTQSRP